MGLTAKQFDHWDETPAQFWAEPMSDFPIRIIEIFARTG
jgi:hypothetical protein